MRVLVLKKCINYIIDYFFFSDCDESKRVIHSQSNPNLSIAIPVLSKMCGLCNMDINAGNNMLTYFDRLAMSFHENYFFHSTCTYYFFVVAETEKKTNAYNIIAIMSVSMSGIIEETIKLNMIINNIMITPVRPYFKRSIASLIYEL